MSEVIDIPEVIDISGDNEYESSRKKSKTGKITCILCFESKKGGGKCLGEHYLCISCTKQYVEKTLMSRGTVFWDRIPCLSEECYSKYMSGLSVQNVLSKRTKTIVEKQQMDASYLIAGERDPASQKIFDKSCKECPNCRVPVMKNGGCSHMVCRVCGFNWWWDCKCKFPFHGENCEKEYAMAPVINN